VKWEREGEIRKMINVRGEGEDKKDDNVMNLMVLEYI
jgi:hypothetical protein